MFHPSGANARVRTYPKRKSFQSFVTNASPVVEIKSHKHRITIPSVDPEARPVLLLLLLLFIRCCPPPLRMNPKSLSKPPRQTGSLFIRLSMRIRG